MARDTPNKTPTVDLKAMNAAMDQIKTADDQRMARTLIERVESQPIRAVSIRPIEAMCGDCRHLYASRMGPNGQEGPWFTCRSNGLAGTSTESWINMARQPCGYEEVLVMDRSTTEELLVHHIRRQLVEAHSRHALFRFTNVTLEQDVRRQLLLVAISGRFASEDFDVVVAVHAGMMERAHRDGRLIEEVGNYVVEQATAQILSLRDERIGPQSVGIVQDIRRAFAQQMAESLDRQVLALGAGELSVQYIDGRREVIGEFPAMNIEVGEKLLGHSSFKPAELKETPADRYAKVRVLKLRRSE